MSERERWVVYPLLFLALGASLRDKLVGSTITKSVVCQELDIVDEGASAQDSPPVLASIRRQPGDQSNGLFVINGDVVVTGTVNATQYTSQGIPILFFLQVPPGTTVPPMPMPSTLPPHSPGGKLPGNPSPAKPPRKPAASAAGSAKAKADTERDATPQK